MTTKLVGDYLPLTFYYKDHKDNSDCICTFFIHKEWIKTGKFPTNIDKQYIRDTTPENLFGVNMKAVLEAVEIK